MATVLVFCEFNEGALKKGTLELLHAAKRSGRAVHAVLLGAGAKDLASHPGYHGAITTWLCADDQLSRYNPELFTAAVCHAIKESGADVVLQARAATTTTAMPKISRAVAGLAAMAGRSDMGSLIVVMGTD